MRPITQKQCALVNIIICSCRSIDNNSTIYTFPGLQTNMRVIRRGSILASSPFINQSRAGGNRTLGERGNAIILICVVLTNTVPMNARTIHCLVQMVGDVDDHPVAPVCNKRRARKGVIDGHESVGRECDFLNLKPVFARNTCVWDDIFLVCVNAIIAPDGSVLGGISCTGSPDRPMGISKSSSRGNWSQFCCWFVGAIGTSNASTK